MKLEICIYLTLKTFQKKNRKYALSILYKREFCCLQKKGQITAFKFEVINIKELKNNLADVS